MSKKVYRSSQGKTVDLGALQLQNETVRAVGNMGVNARGDQINSQNKTVDKRSTRIGKQYKKQVSNVLDDHVPETKHDRPKKMNKQDKRKVKNDIVEPNQNEANLFSNELAQPEAVSIPTVEKEAVEKEDKPAPLGGLANAIAKAKTIKQEPLKTPRQLSQEKNGVKKI